MVHVRHHFLENIHGQLEQQHLVARDVPNVLACLDAVVFVPGELFRFNWNVPEPDPLVDGVVAVGG